MDVRIDWTLNALDYILLAIILIFFIYGYKRGFVYSFLSLFGVAIAFIIAILYYPYLLPWLKAKTTITQPFDSVVAFCILFAVAKLGLAIVGRMLNVVAKAPGIHRLNRWLGALLALVEAGIVIALAIYIMDAIESPRTAQWLEGSQIAGVVKEYVPDLAAATKLFMEQMSRK